MKFILLQIKKLYESNKKVLEKNRKQVPLTKANKSKILMKKCFKKYVNNVGFSTKDNKNNHCNMKNSFILTILNFNFHLIN
jgi:hypothetical protein